jgi:nucleoside-diphosphate-sugar epimerase
MNALVTGTAGFIGSTLAAALVRQGHEVRGVDCLTPYYSIDEKQVNLRSIPAGPAFHFTPADLRVAPIEPLLEGIDTVFHLAAQPGVRASWSDGFHDYLEQNVLVTQRMLEATRTSSVSRFVLASSSSVYGNAHVFPTTEEAPLAPFSPYGITKVAAEQLCSVYAENWGLPTVALRYFTVYGPRQRPDMAIRRLLESAATGRPFPLFGPGHQVRDFTFVADVVDATIRAGVTDLPPGTALNIAGGSATTLDEVINLVAELSGVPVPIKRHAEQAGDVRRTGGDIARARRLLRWEPGVDLRTGLAAMVAWRFGRVSAERQAVEGAPS